MSNTLYLPVGVPGCGKSRQAFYMVSHSVFKESAIVSPDELRERLTDDRANQQCNGKVFSLVDQIINYRLSQGLDIYLDATNLTTRDRNALIQKVNNEHSHYNIHILYFDIPEEVVRIQNTWRPHVVPDEAMDRMFNRWRAFDPTFYKGMSNVTVHTINHDGYYDAFTPSEVPEYRRTR